MIATPASARFTGWHGSTGVDRKTIRRYQALRAGAEANSPGEVTTGSVSADGQIPPPRPPAFGTSEATVTSSLARSACEAHRTWIEEQVRLKRNELWRNLGDDGVRKAAYRGG
ncbi:hypothetical protein ACVME9_002776 [Bradyrhizobium liaoningense]